MLDEDYIKNIPRTDYLKANYGATTVQEIYEDYWSNLSEPFKKLRGARCKLPLPYYAPDHPPIPSPAEILHALKHNNLKRPEGQCPVGRIGQTVIKVDTNVMIWQEAENLHFINQNTKVQAPKLLAAYENEGPLWDRPEGTTVYVMIMEFVEGYQMSNKLFNGLPRRDQHMVLQAVAEQIQNMRAVKPSIEPEGPRHGYYGRVNYQGYHPQFQFLTSPPKGLQGPWDTYESFIEAVTRADLDRCMLKVWDGQSVDHLRQGVLDLQRGLQALKGHEPVLTHLDLKWANMIIQPLDDKEDGKGPASYRAVFLDWEYFGWLPAYIQKYSLGFSLRLPERFNTHKGEVPGFTKDQYKTELEFLKSMHFVAT